MASAAPPEKTIQQQLNELNDELAKDAVFATRLMEIVRCKDPLKKAELQSSLAFYLATRDRPAEPEEKTDICPACKLADGEKRRFGVYKKDNGLWRVCQKCKTHFPSLNKV